MVLSGVSGTGNFLMLDDVYDYTMIYHNRRGGRGRLLKVGWVGWSAGCKPVYEFGISVSGKMGFRITPYLDIYGTGSAIALWQAWRAR